jgi:hypothetical protein
LVDKYYYRRDYQKSLRTAGFFDNLIIIMQSCNSCFVGSEASSNARDSTQFFRSRPVRDSG